MVQGIGVRHLDVLTWSTGRARSAPDNAERSWFLFVRARILILVAAALTLAACGAARPGGGSAPLIDSRAPLALGLSDDTLREFTSAMTPGVNAIAMRHLPGRRTDFWGRPLGWEKLDLATPPGLGFTVDDNETAQEVNSLRPFSKLPIRPMRPFVLQTDGVDQARALTCLSQAVYYESAREPALGQAAIAQVVLNRLRHPAYPKSVCGVVYQGAARQTGCQFTFTCDGALAHAPVPALWSQAQSVARRALAGFVVKDVGSATHYHAAYVAPYWAPTLVKMKQIGQHIFYRWTGPWGEPAAFTGRYAGGENNLSAAILGSLDARTQGLFNPEVQGLSAGRTVTLAVAGEVRTYTVADQNAVGGERTRVLGTIAPSRRKPTPAEIKEINDALAAVEKAGEPTASTPTSSAPSLTHDED
jgi:spore germination cell wall hydrolase CwlJ-like protein